VSEEKDLTNEVTIDSLKEMAIKFSKDIYVNRVLVNAINLIQDLKAENEGFGETINEASETLRNQRAKIEMLKINIENEKKWGKIQVKQERKETAREILGELDLFFKGTTFRQGYEFKKINEKLKEMAKNHDVGVDYEN
jgi:hypothetical protein